VYPFCLLFDLKIPGITGAQAMMPGGCDGTHPASHAENGEVNVAAAFEHAAMNQRLELWSAGAHTHRR
jgi:hypothetical protein